MVDKAAATGITIPEALEDYRRPFSESLVQKLGDSDVNRQIFSSKHDPRVINAYDANMERYMKEIGEVKLEENVNAVRSALTESMDVLDGVLPNIKHNDSHNDNAKESLVFGNRTGSSGVVEDLKSMYHEGTVPSYYRCLLLCFLCLLPRRLSSFRHFNARRRFR